MTGAPTTIDWRVGYLRTLLPIAVHGVALGAAIEIAWEWSVGLLLIGVVVLSAMSECRTWLRERGRAHSLTLIAGGIGIDAAVFRAHRAWFGPGCSAVWLKAAKQRRLLYVVRDEIAAANHAALRRHLKSLKLD